MDARLVRIRFRPSTGSSRRRGAPGNGAHAGAGSHAYARWVGRLARTYCRVVGTPVIGRTRTSGASVSGSASAAAKSPTSRSTHGPPSSMPRPTGASRSAGAAGAVRLSPGSCIDGAHGCTSERISTSASAIPAVAVARRSTPGTCHRSVDPSARPRPRTSSAGFAERPRCRPTATAVREFSDRCVGTRAR
jgi:hypothetical protein